MRFALSFPGHLCAYLVRRVRRVDANLLSALHTELNTGNGIETAYTDNNCSHSRW